MLRKLKNSQGSCADLSKKAKSTLNGFTKKPTNKVFGLILAPIEPKTSYKSVPSKELLSSLKFFSPQIFPNPAKIPGHPLSLQG